MWPLGIYTCMNFVKLLSTFIQLWFISELQQVLDLVLDVLVGKRMLPWWNCLPYYMWNCQLAWFHFKYCERLIIFLQSIFYFSIFWQSVKIYWSGFQPFYISLVFQLLNISSYTNLIILFYHNKYRSEKCAWFQVNRNCLPQKSQLQK